MRIFVKANRVNGKRITEMYIQAEDRNEKKFISKLKKATKKGAQIGTVRGEKLYLHTCVIRNKILCVENSVIRKVDTERAGALRKFLSQSLTARGIRACNGKRWEHGGIVIQRRTKNRKWRTLFFSLLPTSNKKHMIQHTQRRATT